MIDASYSHADRLYGSSTTGGTGKLSCGGGEGVCHSNELPPHGFAGAGRPHSSAVTQFSSTVTSEIAMMYAPIVEMS